MDANRFDNLAKSLATTSRRKVLKGLVGSVLGAFAGTTAVVRTAEAGHCPPPDRPDDTIVCGTGGNHLCCNECQKMTGCGGSSPKCEKDSAFDGNECGGTDSGRICCDQDTQGFEGRCCPPCQRCNNNHCQAHSSTNGRVCGGGSGTCVDSGTCQCVAGETLCNYLCINTDSDLNNCGSCGNTCTSAPANATATCADGQCGFTCDSGYKACNGACIDELACCDNSDCDDNDPCTANTCDDGLCSDVAVAGCCSENDDCDAGEVCDPGTNTCVECVNDTDCSGNLICNESTCECASGTELCNGSCVDLDTDAANCGGCGNACPTGASCSNGECSCPGDQEACGSDPGACTDTDTDVSNCGTCGTECPEPDNGTATCVAGNCGVECDSTFKVCNGDCIPDDDCCDADDCTDGPIGTTGACVNGTCTYDECASGYYECEDACIPDDDCCTNANCGAGEVCNTATNTCVACLTNDDCDGDLVCDASDNTCVGCTDDTHCPDPNECTLGVCDETLRVCDQVDRDPGEVCSGGVCSEGFCVACLSDADCEGALVCDTTDNTCGECAADTDCPGDQICSSNTCACPGGTVTCNGSCVDLATDDTNCGVCGNTCSQCQTCSGGSCVAANEGGSCGDGLICQSGSCVAADPCQGVSCPECQTCVDGACVVTNEGGGCSDGGTCQAGVCVAAEVPCEQPRCVIRCGDVCTDLRTDPQNCGRCGTVCPSGLCYAGRCMTECPRGFVPSCGTCVRA